MKAAEYFDKYGEPIYAEILIGKADKAREMLHDFYVECKEVMQKRKAHTDRAVIATFREFNDKWNSVARMFEKKYGEEIIRKNGFYNAARKHIPELPALVGGLKE